MNRAIPILSAVEALSAVLASGAHAAALRGPLDRPERLWAVHASAAPLQQGGGKGHGGGGGQHGGGGRGGGGQHGGGARQGGGGHRAGPPSGGGRQAHGGGGHARRTETHASGRGRGFGAGGRAVRASRSTRTTERASGRSTTLTRRGAAARTASVRGSEHAARLLSSAAATGRGRGLASDAVNVRNENGRVRLLNRRGDVLMDLTWTRTGTATSARGACAAWATSVGGERRNGEHVAGRVAQGGLGHAAEHQPRAPPPRVGAHHQQIGVPASAGSRNARQKKRAAAFLCGSVSLAWRCRCARLGRFRTHASCANSGARSVACMRSP
jgi:hypothetical protein